MKYENQAYASKDLVLPSPWHEATPAAHITVTAVKVKGLTMVAGSIYMSTFL